jgi:hypothetical protein
MIRNVSRTTASTICVSHPALRTTEVESIPIAASAQLTLNANLETALAMNASLLAMILPHPMNFSRTNVNVHTTMNANLNTATRLESVPLLVPNQVQVPTMTTVSVTSTTSVSPATVTTTSAPLLAL